MHISKGRARSRTFITGLLILVAGLAMLPTAAHAASSAGCEGGGFWLRLGDGSTLSGDQQRHRAGEPADRHAAGPRQVQRLGPRRGRPSGSSTTPSRAPRTRSSITSGQRVVAFASKVPDHRGLSLSGPAQVRHRRGEPRDLPRGQRPVDEAAGQGLRPGRRLPDGAGALRRHAHAHHPHAGCRARSTSTTRTSGRARATRCRTRTPRSRSRRGSTSPTTSAAVRRPRQPAGRHPRDAGMREHRSRPAAAGRDRERRPLRRRVGVGRGQRRAHGRRVGEDSTEVAPPATTCTHQCQAQNRVRGQSVVLGFPSPVPDASRLSRASPPEG